MIYAAFVIFIVGFGLVAITLYLQQRLNELQAEVNDIVFDRIKRLEEK